MKKPAIRILLLVVLLGLAIYYFRYIREGFEAAEGSEATKKIDKATMQAVRDAKKDQGIAFTEGSSCVDIGSGSKTEKTTGKTVGNTTLYCCDGKWSSTAC